jgi:hypothetical protein
MKYSQYIKDGLLAWTLTSNGYKYLTWNFVLHWRRAVPGWPILVVCADKPSYQFLQREGISCVMWDTALADFGPQVVAFGTRQFATLNRLKLRLLETFAADEAVQQCLYIDGDIIIYKNIVEDIQQRLLDSPFLMQCDEQVHECTRGDSSCPNLCSGLIAFQHGADGGVFKITDEAVWSQKPEDQVWVNYSIRQNQIPVTALPRIQYPNGARATLTKTNPDLSADAICLHYNYRVGNSKKVDMQRFSDWLLPY